MLLFQIQGISFSGSWLRLEMKKLTWQVETFSNIKKIKYSEDGVYAVVVIITMSLSRNIAKITLSKWLDLLFKRVK